MVNTPYRPICHVNIGQNMPNMNNLSPIICIITHQFLQLRAYASLTKNSSANVNPMGAFISYFSLAFQYF